ncbi:DUF2922 domain-containing protein [Lysinibacillus antri]|nr:DUF2922 domain-containing protein [Lysinibacillus antri]
MDTKTVLQMEFTNYEGKSVSISLADPREDLTAEEVQTFMELVNDLRLLTKINGPDGDMPAKLKGAKTVETVSSDFGIVVE